jgi:hypothetical protein
MKKTNISNQDKLAKAKIILFIETVKTAEKIKEKIDLFPYGGIERDLLLAKWSELSKNEIEKANNLQEIIKAYNNAPPRSKEK